MSSRAAEFAPTDYTMSLDRSPHRMGYGSSDQFEVGTARLQRGGTLGTSGILHKSVHDMNREEDESLLKLAVEKPPEIPGGSRFLRSSHFGAMPEAVSQAIEDNVSSLCERRLALLLSTHHAPGPAAASLVHR